ncbi:MAG: hypothetical protein ABEJ27_01310 [Halodesulfurarchaeum sp.]
MSVNGGERSEPEAEDRSEARDRSGRGAFGSLVDGDIVDAAGLSAV